MRGLIPLGNLTFFVFICAIIISQNEIFFVNKFSNQKGHFFLVASLFKGIGKSEILPDRFPYSSPWLGIMT